MINDLSRHLGPLRADLDAALRRVLATNWFVTGEEGRSFEAEFAAYCGVQHCVGVASGTDAIELSLRAVGVSPGDAVVTVANAGLYSSIATLAIGARPSYVDVEPDSLLMDLDALERALDPPAGRPLPAAVVVTHLYGQLVDMPAVVARTSRVGVPVVEDCAQAHGASWQGRRCGSFGAAAAFSFYPTKNLGAIGDGGAVVSQSGEVAAAVRQLRQYGWETKYVATRPGGRNSRLDEVQAAVLRTLLPHLDEWNDRRRRVLRGYLRLLTHPDVRLSARGGPADVGHLLVIRSGRRDELRAHLATRGIASDVHYPQPDHRQVVVRAMVGDAASLPVTERACREVLTLPCFPELTDDEVAAICSAVNAW